LEKQAKTPEEIKEENAIALQSLIRSKIVRRYFLENGEEKREATEKIVSLVSTYVREMQAMKAALAVSKDVVNPSEGLHLFEELVDTLDISVELEDKLRKRMVYWTRLSEATSAFNKVGKKWVTKFCSWFMVRGLQSHAVNLLCSKRGKFKSSLKSCEEHVSHALGYPVSVLTFIDRPSKHVQDLVEAVTKLRDVTPTNHPEMVCLSLMLNRLVSAQECDEQMKNREAEAKRNMEALQERSSHMSGLPKHFIRYGRFFVAEGDLFKVKEDKGPSPCHFVLLNDLLLLGRQKGKKFSAHDSIEFDIATIRDVPDGTEYGDHKMKNAFAINIAADTIVLSFVDSDQKKEIRSLLEKTLEGYKQDVIRRRDEKATLIVSGL